MSKNAENTAGENPAQETKQEANPNAAGEPQTASETPNAASETPQAPQKEPSELETLRRTCEELSDKYLRLLAEYDNYRKRSQRERDAIYPEATAAAVQGFLVVADNFQRALACPCADPEYKKGTEMTYKSLTDALERMHIESFGEAGDCFDPAFHNAVMHVENSDAEPGTVLEVFQKGYKIADKVLRYAMVKVAN
jgi:molecular chaperone GrpE